MHRTRTIALTGLAVSLALTAGTALAWLAEFGIEGMGVVSTRADETAATIAPDGSRIVFATDRAGGAGGSDLWSAALREKRWQDARPLAGANAAGDELDPMFSADGRWLYFASDRRGGAGGTDLYRVSIDGRGRTGQPDNLGPAINTAGHERAPRPLDDGRLLFASDGRAAAGGLDLFVAAAGDGGFAPPVPLPGVNTRADESDAALLHGGRALLFARSADLRTGPVRLWLVHCDGRRFGDAEPWSLSFNTAEGRTRAAAVDASRPAELLASGSARAPRAGAADLYRMKAPASSGVPGCL